MGSHDLIIMCAITKDDQDFSSIALQTLAQTAMHTHGLLIIGVDEFVALPLAESEYVHIIRHPQIQNRYQVLNLLFDNMEAQELQNSVWAIADTSAVNDELDIGGVRDAIHMVKTGIMDVACANQRLFYYDRPNLKGSAPLLRFSGAVQSVKFAFGGFAIYNPRILKDVRFRTGSMYDFNNDISGAGARFSVVPWMVNSGHDKFYLATVIVLLLTFAVLFVCLT